MEMNTFLTFAVLLLITAIAIIFILSYRTKKAKANNAEQPTITTQATVVSKSVVMKDFLTKLYFETENGEIVHLNENKKFTDLVMVGDKGTLTYRPTDHEIVILQSFIRN